MTNKVNEWAGLCAQIDTIEEIDEYFAEPQP